MNQLYALSLLWGVAAIFLLVLLHEGGHYLAARFYGVECPEFSIGVGPRLFGFRRFGTAFNVRAIPLGGFVNIRTTETASPEAPTRPWERDLSSLPRFKQAVVLVAGVAVNVVAAWAFFTASGLVGHRDFVATAGPVAEGTLMARAGLVRGDTFLSVDNEPVRSFSDLLDKLNDRAGRPGVRVIVKRAGRTTEFPLDLSGVAIIADPASVGLTAERAVRIMDVLEGSPAEAGGLRRGDVLLTLEGEPCNGACFLKAANSNPGRPLALVVRRQEGGSAAEVALTVTPGTDGRFGVAFRAWADPVIVRVPLAEAPAYGWDRAWVTFKNQWNFLTALVSGGERRPGGAPSDGGASADQLSGPIGIGLAAGVSAFLGAGAFLGFLGQISMALAFINLVPIPALDGGRLVILGVEGVLGRRIGPKTVNALMGVSLFLMLGLVFWTSVNDIGRFG